MTETGFRSRCIRTHPSSTCLLRRLAFLPVCFFILSPCFRGFANSRITETHSILQHFRRDSQQKVPKNFFLSRLLSPRTQREESTDIKEIESASVRARVCDYGSISVIAVT